MMVGIKKCGVMCVGNNEPCSWNLTADQGQDLLHLQKIMLMGKPVPVVKEYVYLGLLFRRDLSLKAMVDARL